MVGGVWVEGENVAGERAAVIVNANFTEVHGYNAWIDDS